MYDFLFLKESVFTENPFLHLKSVNPKILLKLGYLSCWTTTCRSRRQNRGQQGPMSYSELDTGDAWCRVLPWTRRG